MSGLYMHAPSECFQMNLVGAGGHQGNHEEEDGEEYVLSFGLSLWF